jgi:hypothetical protein
MEASLSPFTKSILVCLEEVEIWIKSSDDIYIPWTSRNWEFPQKVTRNFQPWGLWRKLCSQLKILFSFTYSFNKGTASQTSLPCFDLADTRKFAPYIQKPLPCLTVIKIWSQAPAGCLTPIQIGRLTVGRNITHSLSLFNSGKWQTRPLVREGAHINKPITVRE